MELIINILLSLGTFVCLSTVIYGCTFCLRYFTVVSTGAGPAAQAKRAALRRAQHNEQIKMAAAAPPTITVYIEPPQVGLEPVNFKDIGVGLEEDAFGCSDALSAYSDAEMTTDTCDSPIQSALNTPGRQHTHIDTVSSQGVNAFHAARGKIMEAGPINVRDPRRSISHDGHSDMTSLSVPGSTRLKRKRSFGMNRSMSVPDIRDYIRPELTFSISYKSKKYHLDVTEIQVKNVGLTSGNVGVKMQLCPDGITARTENRPAPVAMDTLTFEGFLRYDDLNESDLQKLSLLVTLSHLSSRSGKKLSTLGEALIKVSEIGVKVDSEVTVMRTLQPKRRSKKNSTSSHSLLRELGELFVLLQYQSHASRVKVLVRKASRLPTGGKLPGQPDHFVAVLLRCGTRILDTRETRPQKGVSPVWNEPFLFDVSGIENIDDVSLEFIIHRGRIYTKDNVLGHVIIGPGAPSSGINHWKDALTPMGMEVARWHPILPVFKYAS